MEVDAAEAGAVLGRSRRDRPAGGLEIAGVVAAVDPQWEFVGAGADLDLDPAAIRRLHLDLLRNVLASLAIQIDYLGVVSDRVAALVGRKGGDPKSSRLVWLARTQFQPRYLTLQVSQHHPLAHGLEGLGALPADAHLHVAVDRLGREQLAEPEADARSCLERRRDQHGAKVDRAAIAAAHATAGRRVTAAHQLPPRPGDDVHDHETAVLAAFSRRAPGVLQLDALRAQSAYRLALRPDLQHIGRAVWRWATANCRSNDPGWHIVFRYLGIHRRA